MVSHCQRTLRGEGHRAAGWGIDVSVWLQIAGPMSLYYSWSDVCLSGQWVPTANAGQYATSNCKLPLFWFPVSSDIKMSGPLTFQINFYVIVLMRRRCFQMAVYGACHCHTASSGPCACAQMVAQMMEDIAQLNDGV